MSPAADGVLKKSHAAARQAGGIPLDRAPERSFEAIRAVLADRNNILTVKDLCELAGVSRPATTTGCVLKNRELREAKDRAAFEQILEAYRFRGYAKGVRGIHMRLCTWVSE